MSARDKVSILIPCYNAGAFIKEAVDSALSQDYENKEVIVIDDGSKDNSIEVLHSFQGRIQVYSRPNKGGNFTRNELLEKASGTWIQYLDADDYLGQGKLSEQMRWIDSNPGHDVVYGPIMLVYENGNETRHEKHDVIFPTDSWAAMVSWDLPQTSSPLFRRSALLDVGGWNINQKVCQEHELYLRLLKAGKKFVGVNEFQSLAHYRQWSGNSVSTKEPLSTYRARIGLMQEALQFMMANKLLTERRGEVFMEWCLLVARGLWHLDPQAAESFVERNKATFPVGSIRSRFLKPWYLFLASWLGFRNSEKVASFFRR